MDSHRSDTRNTASTWGHLEAWSIEVEARRDGQTSGLGDGHDSSSGIDSASMSGTAARVYRRAILRGVRRVQQSWRFLALGVSAVEALEEKARNSVHYGESDHFRYFR